MEKCVACQHYDRNDVQTEGDGIRWGKCRRTGPIINPASAKAYMVEGIWPHVRDDDWCGEWSASKRRLDSPATIAMNSLLMHTGPSVPRPGVQSGGFVSPDPSVEKTAAVPTLMRGSVASD